MISHKVLYTKKLQTIQNKSNAFQTDQLEGLSFANLSLDQRAILIGICVIVMLGIIFTNIIVIMCLIRTNQTGNLSFRTKFEYPL